MTRKLFWEDPYLTQADTLVTSVGGDDVSLEATILYALSGGQESDQGSIGGWPVLEARKEGRQIVYTLPTAHDLKLGDAVSVAIDWERRYRLMRLHFAAELILELVYRHRPGTEKVGAHIAADKARIDFAWEGSISPLLPTFAEQANAIVVADMPIESAFSDEASERRYWKIDNFARVPCGGTHLTRTGEVGLVSLKRKNIGKGKERIEITVDINPSKEE